MKKISILCGTLLCIFAFSACGANETKATTESVANELISTIESEVSSEMSSETVSLTAEEQKLQDSFDSYTNNGSTSTIEEVEPLIFEVHYKVSWSSSLDDYSNQAGHTYSLIESAVTEAYGEHDPITVRIYDENGTLVATNENSENYWEMQTVE